MALGSNARGNSRSSDFRNSQTHKRTGKTPLPLKILYFCITLVIGAFIFANIKPYGATR